MFGNDKGKVMIVIRDLSGFNSIVSKWRAMIAE